MTDLDTKAIRERAEKAITAPDSSIRRRNFYRTTLSDVPALCLALDAARAERDEALKWGADQQALVLPLGIDGLESVRVFGPQSAQILGVVIGQLKRERDAARAELAQAKQQREMLREALKKWERADDTPMSHPDFDVRFNEARTTGDAALDGTKETA